MSILKTLIGSKQIENDDRIPFINNNDKEDLCFMKYGTYRFYWNNCSEIYDKKGLLNFDLWNDIKYLDYKITKDMFNFEESYKCLENFLSNIQPKKLLHIVNTHHDNKSLFEMDEWNTLIITLDKYSLNNVIIEIVNKSMSSIEPYQFGVEECKKIHDSARLEYFLFEELDQFIYHDEKYFDHGRLI
jgi:hypothetical protein|tara:strand:- start:1432 stop:1992 length:561 start_codon:yes stop_codon:yes gene_type:complete